MTRHLAAIALLALAAAARADWILTSADFKTTPKITVNEWTAKDGLSYTAESGKLVTVPTRQLLSLTSDRPKAISSAKWQLLLRNGDLLEGEPAGMRQNFLQFTVAEVGTVEVPFKLVSLLQAKDAKMALPAPGAASVAEKDVITLKNNDTLAGALMELDANKVKIQSDLGESSLEWSRINRLALGGAVPPRTVPPLSLRLTFATGSTLTAKADTFRWAISDMAFKDPADQERKVAADQVQNLEVLGGRVVWLTELDPAKEVQTPTFGTTRIPVQINRNTNTPPGPLKVAKQPFDRGLGVHTRSVLTYELDGSFETLSLRAGIDDSAAPYGEANLSIVLDGKTIWKVDGLTVGKLTEPLMLPIKGGKKLELHADPGTKLDVEGRVDWLNPALIRP